MESGRRDDDANRAVPISLFFTYFAKQNERERREYYFIGSARGQHLARADRVAKRFRALFWQVFFQEGRA